MHRLGPQLVDLILESEHGAVVPGSGNRHDPVPPFSGIVSEEAGLVGGTCQDALSRMSLCGTGISSSVPVRGSRDEVLDLCLIALLHAIQFAHLHDPHTLEQLCGLFAHVCGPDGVGEEAPCQQPQHPALSDTLRTAGNEHLVKLTPGSHDTIHTGHHPQLGDLTVQWRVLGAQPPDEHGGDSGRSVPSQSGQIGADGVVGVFQGHDPQRVVQDPVALPSCWEAHRLKVRIEVGPVVFRPRVLPFLRQLRRQLLLLFFRHILEFLLKHVLQPVILLRLPPRQFSLDGDHVAHGVVSQLSFEVR